MDKKRFREINIIIDQWEREKKCDFSFNNPEVIWRISNDTNIGESELEEWMREWELRAELSTRNAIWENN